MPAAVQPALGPATGLRVEQIPVPVPVEGNVLVHVSHSAVNFADRRLCEQGFSHFTGRIETPPFVPGGEVAGVRADTGERVVALPGTGGFATQVTVPEERVFGVPDGLDVATALCAFVPGLTAVFLLRAAGPLDRRSVVVTGASGAVGSLVVQLLRHHSAPVIAISDARASDLDPLAGVRKATVVLPGNADDLAERLRKAAGGPIDVVLDCVGGRVFEESLAATGRHGLVVTYGNASSSSTSVEPRTLFVGSKTVRGFWLMDWLARDDARTGQVVAGLMVRLRDGDVQVPTPRTFALSDVHAALAASHERARRGRVLLTP